jgi:hypothetical protein
MYVGNIQSTQPPPESPRPGMNSPVDDRVVAMNNAQEIGLVVEVDGT